MWVDVMGMVMGILRGREGVIWWPEEEDGVCEKRVMRCGCEER